MKGHLGGGEVNIDRGLNKGLDKAVCMKGHLGGGGAALEGEQVVEAADGGVEELAHVVGEACGGGHISA